MKKCTCPCRLLGARDKHGCTVERDEFPKIECFVSRGGVVDVHPCTACRRANLRILVTGSRDISPDDIDRVWAVLELEMAELCMYDVAPIVVQGGARGVDQMAIEWAKRKGYMVETHRPDYGRYGRNRAPHVRNGQMVNLGAHRVVGIIKDESSGTAKTLEKARKAGLQVHEHKWDE